MQLVITGDGSHTLYLPNLNEHYHSSFGAINESMHVFIRNGLDLVLKRNITVFEVGLGTGLNALLTSLASVDRGISITYYSIEKNPVDQEIVNKLNYPELLSRKDNQSHELFSAIHNSPWNQLTRIHACFLLHKVLGDIQNYIPDFYYDLIYFDAFSPDKQPEMWTFDIFQHLISHLNPGGIFSTYCAKGTVRRMLMENGLAVDRLPGPPGKREMLKGVKKANSE